MTAENIVLSIHKWGKKYRLKMTVKHQSFLVGKGSLEEVNFTQNMMDVALRKTGANVICDKTIHKFLY